MTVYGYCRVSTDRQAEDGESLGVQQRAILGYAMMHGLDVSHTYIETGVSGSVPLADRPQGSLLLGALAAADVVIVPKMDRAFRSSLDALGTLAEFKRIGAHLHLIDLGGDVVEGSIGKLVFSILAAVAEDERDRIRERVRTVKRDQASRNRYLGGLVPFGHVVDAEGGLVEIPDQIAQVGRMRELRAAGLSYRAIAGRMAEADVSISHMGVKRLLVGAMP